MFIVSIHSWNKYHWASTCPHISCVAQIQWCAKKNRFKPSWRLHSRKEKKNEPTEKINTLEFQILVSPMSNKFKTKGHVTLCESRGSKNLLTDHGRLFEVKIWKQRLEEWKEMAMQWPRWNFQAEGTGIDNDTLLSPVPTNWSIMTYYCSHVWCSSHWAFWNANHIPFISLPSCHFPSQYPMPAHYCFS